MFWLGPAAFWLWCRPRKRRWFQPWMWGLFAAYIGFVFLWAINLTLYWGWWFPIFFLPFFGWWGVTHGYTQSLWLRKATALVPMVLRRGWASCWPSTAFPPTTGCNRSWVAIARTR